MIANAVTGANCGVLLVGHGTRDQQGTDQFLQLGARLAQRLAPVPVAASLLEFQSPTIPEAWQSLMQQGVQHVHVAPLLLFAAGHAKDDIPNIIAECQRQSPAVTVDQSRPISRHPALIQLATRRLVQSLRQLRADANRTAVVMVGRGSHDPCAQADMRVLSEVIRVRVPAADVVTAFYAMAHPRVPQVIDQVAASGRFDAIVVHPHLLFAGRLYQAIEQQTQQAAQKYPHLELSTSQYLGPDALVAEAIASRIGQIAYGLRDHQLT